MTNKEKSSVPFQGNGSKKLLARPRKTLETAESIINNLEIYFRYFFLQISSNA